MNPRLQELMAHLGEVDDLNRMRALLNWDQQTNMPPGGARDRANQLSTVSRLAHEFLVSERVGELLTDLGAESAGLEYDSFDASLLRATRREYDRRRRLPSDLVGRLAKARSLGHMAWEKAREQSDFEAFRPHLEEIVELTLEKAEVLGYEDRPYDALLDQFEPEMKAAQVEILFGEMKAELVPLVQAIHQRQDAVDDSLFDQDYDVDRQWDFGLDVLRQIGFDFERGRQDRAVHPFTTSFSVDDVRLTTRLRADMFKSALFASIHEAGHGMYEQGYAPEMARTTLCREASLGVHESQSRMWENVVGRSRGFWTYWLPRLKGFFPAQLDGVDVEAFYRAVNRVKPSLIRVEADEVTYNLHIFLRFEIENLMIEGKVQAADLPDLWNAKMEEYLGVWPDGNANGVLQDVHWSSGYIGYFPTYSLGNLLSVQFYAQAVADIPDIPAQIERGEFAALLGWMRDKIHHQGRKYTPAELVERITGGPIRTQPFLDYVKAKYTDLYDL